MILLCLDTLNTDTGRAHNICPWSVCYLHALPLSCTLLYPFYCPTPPLSLLCTHILYTHPVKHTWKYTNSLRHTHCDVFCEGTYGFTQIFMHIPTSTLMHLLVNTHTQTHWCHVMFGVAWSPDEWNFSVGSRSIEHHRGSLLLQKSTKLQSRSSARSHTRTHRHERMLTQLCVCVDMCAHAARLIHAHTGNTLNSEEGGKNPTAVTHTHKVTKAHKNMFILTRKDKRTAGLFFSADTHTHTQALTISHNPKKKII